MTNDVNFTPDIQSQAPIRPFRFACQTVLPLVYDDSLSYYELLCKCVQKLNEVITASNNVHTDIQALLNAYNQLQAYVNDYFKNLDLQAEIDAKLDEMVESGAFYRVFSPLIAEISIPRVVDSVPDMVNHNYTYVLKSNGHMYQFVNNMWVDTGYVFGGEIGGLFGIKEMVPSDLNDINEPGIYYHTKSGANVTNGPVGVALSNADFMIIDYKKSPWSNYQLLYVQNTGASYVRFQISVAEWSNWQEFASVGDHVPTTDLNTVRQSGVFFHQLNDEPVVNTPDDSVYTDKRFTVVSITGSTLGLQIFFSYENSVVMFRIALGALNTWSTWTPVYINHRFLPNSDLNLIRQSGYWVHASVDNTATNTPYNKWGEVNFMVECHAGGGSLFYQIFYPYNQGGCFMRRGTGSSTWSEWVCVNTTGGKLPDADLDKVFMSGTFFHDAGDAVASNLPGDVSGNSPFMLENAYGGANDKHYQRLTSKSLGETWTRRGSGAGSMTPWVKQGSGSNSEYLGKLVPENQANFHVVLGDWDYTIQNYRATGVNTWTVSHATKGAFVQPLSLVTGYLLTQNGSFGGTAKGEKSDACFCMVDGVKMLPPEITTEINFKALDIIISAIITDENNQIRKTSILTFTKNGFNILCYLTGITPFTVNGFFVGRTNIVNPSTVIGNYVISAPVSDGSYFTGAHRLIAINQYAGIDIQLSLDNAIYLTSVANNSYNLHANLINDLNLTKDSCALGSAKMRFY